MAVRTQVLGQSPCEGRPHRTEDGEARPGWALRCDGHGAGAHARQAAASWWSAVWWGAVAWWGAVWWDVVVGCRIMAGCRGVVGCGVVGCRWLPSTLTRWFSLSLTHEGGNVHTLPSPQPSHQRVSVRGAEHVARHRVSEGVRAGRRPSRMPASRGVTCRGASLPPAAPGRAQGVKPGGSSHV